MVSVPPRIAQVPMGMSRRDSGISVRDEMRDITGRNSAVAPTFCITPEIRPTVPDTSGTIRPTVLPPTLSIHLETTVIAPVRSSPAPRIITAMMEITALDANPLNRSRDGTRPSRPMATITRSAAISTRTSSETNRPMVALSTISTSTISCVS